MNDLATSSDFWLHYIPALEYRCAAGTRRVFNWKIAKGNQILISASVNTQEQNLQLKACSLNLPN